MKLSGWGNYPCAEVSLHRPRGDVQMRDILRNHANVIARGNGRSYGDSALNATATVSLLRSDRLIDFDTKTGVLTCESGVLLSDILQHFVPLGWFIPVTPGTKFVTIGGMVAADVHGKNHHHAGSFSKHVTALQVMGADGEIVTCSAVHNAEHFWATCGGMGLTGIIVRVSVRLQSIETAYIRQTTKRTGNLVETMQAFADAQSIPYSVAWIDCLAGGDALGRAVLYLGEHATREHVSHEVDPLRINRRRSVVVPFYMPGFLLNRFTARAFNYLYYARASDREMLVDYETFFYPLDGVRDWNRMYGRKGFLQYQCVLPLDSSNAGIAELLKHIRRSGSGSFLAVLKLLGEQGQGALSFPMRGYTLALDFPVSSSVFNLLNELDAIVSAHGGRIYLAKDARMHPSMMQRGYPGMDAFITHHMNPAFASLQSQRLGLSS